MGGNWTGNDKKHMIAGKFVKCSLIVKWDGKSMKENATAGALSQTFDWCYRSFIYKDKGIKW
jgi:hypothetical protein